MSALGTFVALAAMTLLIWLDARKRILQREALRQALVSLPPDQRQVVELAYYGGYTHTEIATMLDTPIGTVKGRMRLGLRKMAVSVPAAI